MHITRRVCSKEALAYWVDVYWWKRTRNRTFIVLSFWNKFLKDKGFAPTEEPFKKLINQE
jgi:leucyl-tRNA synthetase